MSSPPDSSPSSSPFAPRPQPPYYAVIFASQRTEGDQGYAAMADAMVALAAQQPGYLGMESTRGTDGFGITVSYWATLDDIKAWRTHAEHALARARGREGWYSGYELRISRVERAYGWRASAGDMSDPAA